MYICCSQLPFDLLNPPEPGDGELIVEGDIVVHSEPHNLKEFSKSSKKSSLNLWPTDMKTGLPTIPIKIEKSGILRFYRLIYNSFYALTQCRIFIPFYLYFLFNLKEVLRRSLGSFISI